MFNKMVQIWFKNDEKCDPARVRNISRFFSRKISGGREWGTLAAAYGAHAFVLFLASSIWGCCHETMARASRVVPRKGTFF